MLDSVRVRLALWHAGILALLLLIFSAGVYAVLWRNFLDRADNVLRSISDATVSILEKELSESGLDEVASRATVKSLHFPDHTIAVFDGDGDLLAERPPGTRERIPLPDLRDLPAEGTRVYTTAGAGSDRESRRVVVSRVHLAPAGRPYIIEISRSLTPLLGELATDRYILMVAVPLVILLAGLAGWFLSRKSLAPVLAMSEQAHRIGIENLDDRLPVVNPRDELGRLAATFNDLLSRLGAAFNSHRRFMADASHELRTPLSVIRTTASVTLARDERREEEYRGALVIVEGQARRLSRMVEDMLNLARADSGHFSVRMQTFHLDEMLLETVQAAFALARGRQTRIELAEMPEAPFRGDEDLIRQMVMNLLDNAVKHTPECGRVSVSLMAGPESWMIRVADTGEGIPEEARPYIFDRFYRVDKVHSRLGTQAEAAPAGSGAGLGLAIARWVAEIHGGTLILEHSGPGGSVFLASLPASV